MSASFSSGFIVLSFSSLKFLILLIGSLHSVRFHPFAFAPAVHDQTGDFSP